MSGTILSPLGKELWEVLCKGAKTLDEENRPSPRRRRRRATFTETELSKRCASYRRDGVESEFWVMAANEKDVSRTRVDFVKTESGKLIASCEVKGPARPTIYHGSDNFYEQLKGKNKVLYGIKPDLDKQHRMARRHPDAEHYALWLLEEPKRPRRFEEGLDSLRGRLCADLPHVDFREVARTAITNEIGPLWLVMYRIY